MSKRQRKSKRERAKKKRLEFSGCGGLVVCFELRDEGKVLGKARMLGWEMLRKGRRACGCTSAAKILRPLGGRDK